MSTNDSSDRKRRDLFDRLCGAFRPDLLRFSLWLTRNKAIAEDVVQETLLRAWNHLDSLRDPIAARGWLLMIARREAARVLARTKVATASIDELSALDESSLAYHATPEIFELRKAIWELPDEYREPLMRQVMFGFTTQEIADQMNASLSATLVRLYRARNKLRERLRPPSADG